MKKFLERQTLSTVTKEEINNLNIPICCREAEVWFKPSHKIEEEETVLHFVRASIIDSQLQNCINILQGEKLFKDQYPSWTQMNNSKQNCKK